MILPSTSAALAAAVRRRAIDWPLMPPSTGAVPSGRLGSLGLWITATPDHLATDVAYDILSVGGGLMSLFDKQGRQRVTLYIDPEHVEAVERIQAAAGNGATLSEVLRFALDRGLPSIESTIEREAQEAARDEAEAAAPSSGG